MTAEKLPHTLRAEELLKTDHSPSSVLRRLREEGFEEITLKAVEHVKARSGAPRINVDASDYVPWSLLPGDRALYDPRMLRYLARRHAKARLTVRENDALDRWLKRLKDADEVIDYQPENCLECEGTCKLAEPPLAVALIHTRKPFVRVPRRKVERFPGEKENLDPPWIRDPSLNDDGTSKWIQGD